MPSQPELLTAVLALITAAQGLMQWRGRSRARALRADADYVRGAIDGWERLADKLFDRESRFESEISRLHGEVMRLQSIITELKGELARLHDNPSGGS